MDIAPFVTRSVLTVDENESLRDAAVSMIERGVGSAVVMSDGRPSGVITDREALWAIAQGRDPATVTVSSFATGKLKTVPPSLGLVEAARIMRERRFRHLVVVDEQGALAGVFSMRDLVVGLMEERRSLLAEVPAGQTASASGGGQEPG